MSRNTGERNNPQRVGASVAIGADAFGPVPGPFPPGPFPPGPFPGPGPCQDVCGPVYPPFPQFPVFPFPLPSLPEIIGPTGPTGPTGPAGQGSISGATAGTFDGITTSGQAVISLIPSPISSAPIGIGLAQQVVQIANGMIMFNVPGTYQVEVSMDVARTAVEATPSQFNISFVPTSGNILVTQSLFTQSASPNAGTMDRRRVTIPNLVRVLNGPASMQIVFDAIGREMSITNGIVTVYRVSN